MHAKSRFRGSLLRFRDRTKICRDQGFSKDHSPPLIKQPLRQPLSICFPCWRRQWLVGANSGPRNRRHPDIRFDDVTVLVKCSEHRLAGRAGVFPLHLIRGCPVASRGESIRSCHDAGYRVQMPRYQRLSKQQRHRSRGRLYEHSRL